MRVHLLLFCFLLGACAMPITIQDTRVVDISYSQAIQNLDSNKNVLVRWGGVIIDVENEEQFSMMQVKFYPLNYLGRPQLDKSSEGYFVIKGAEFPNPVVYTKNMEITVVGTIKGDIERTVDGEIIRVPLIVLNSIPNNTIQQSAVYPYIWERNDPVTGDDVLTGTVGTLRDLAISPYIFLYYVCCAWWDQQGKNL